jgi:hypothetical protein
MLFRRFMMSELLAQKCTILGLAGRRIDATEGGARRFPPDNIRLVRDRIRALFMAENVNVLISSGACGADLIAQTEAVRLGIRARLILPFEPNRFRETSVIDRPGDWRDIYNSTVERAAVAGDLVVLSSEFGPYEAYLQATKVILDEAVSLAGAAQDVLTVVVWEGYSGRPDDLTAVFKDEARIRGCRIAEIYTL